MDANAAPNPDEYMDDRLSPSGELPWYVSYCLTLFCIRMLRGLQVNFQNCVQTSTHIPGKIEIHSSIAATRAACFRIVRYHFAILVMG